MGAYEETGHHVQRVVAVHHSADGRVYYAYVYIKVVEIRRHYTVEIIAELIRRCHSRGACPRDEKKKTRNTYVSGRVSGPDGDGLNGFHYGLFLLQRLRPLLNIFSSVSSMNAIISHTHTHTHTQSTQESHCRETIFSTQIASHYSRNGRVSTYLIQ